ncbi:MAG: hypothetical protein HY200_01630 [Nitrospirae bacterium]|nr:hypothetical protein [Nitrospirota bacterium]MBI3593637.1 hypothetical protein [Nitrospirota bacterium]
MITCAQCNASNLESRHFCGQCGIKMVFSCPQCHFINLSGDHYCGSCGSSFAVRPSPKEFLKETDSSSENSASQVKKTSSYSSSKAIQEFLNSEKISKGKRKPSRDEKKQVSQDEIERLIHESLKEGKES